jgi:hypothetical protein
MGAGAARGAEELVGPRALGMADALRAAAAGPAGLYLNPAGIALTKAYIVESSYLYGSRDGYHGGNIALTDSSTSLLSAGVFFSYIHADPAFGGRTAERRGYEAGVALAAMLSDQVALGVTGRFVDLSLTLPGDGTAAVPPVTLVDYSRELNIDVGGVWRVGPKVSLAAVGYNLTSSAPAAGTPTLYPRSLGLGLSFGPSERMLVGADVVLDFQSVPDSTRARFGAGVEYMFEVVAVRAGYGYRELDESHALTAGLSYVSEQMALDLGLRQQVNDDTPTLFTAGVRLFLQ